MNLRSYLTAVRRKKDEDKSQSKEGIFVVERRKHPRVSIEIPLEYSIIAEGKETHGGISADASEGGLLVYIPEVMEIGTLLQIEILFVEGPELNTIKGIARVVWSDLADKESWGENRYGLQFQTFQVGDINKLKILLKEVGKTHDRSR